MLCCLTQGQTASTFGCVDHTSLLNYVTVIVENSQRQHINKQAWLCDFFFLFSPLTFLWKISDMHKGETSAVVSHYPSVVFKSCFMLYCV